MMENKQETVDDMDLGAGLEKYLAVSVLRFSFDYKLLISV